MENQPKNKKVENKSPEVVEASGVSYLEPIEKVTEIEDFVSEVEEIEVTKNIPVITEEEKKDFDETFKSFESCSTLGTPEERLNCIRNILYKGGID